ncbi:hypothetical protein D3C83_52350 [compost metagenome]
MRAAGLSPAEWACHQEIYGGSVRGWLNFLAKRIHGEPLAEIQAQNRLEGGTRWDEFSTQIKGRPSRLMRSIDRFDIWLAPRLDRVLDALGLGFIMSVHARKDAAGVA